MLEFDGKRGFFSLSANPELWPSVDKTWPSVCCCYVHVCLRCFASRACSAASSPFVIALVDSFHSVESFARERTAEPFLPSCVLGINQCTWLCWQNRTPINKHFPWLQSARVFSKLSERVQATRPASVLFVISNSRGEVRSSQDLSAAQGSLQLLQ